MGGKVMSVALRALVVGASVAAATLLTTGCGSSASKSSTTTAPASTATAPAAVQTRAAYIVQADAVCKQGDAELEALTKKQERIEHEHLGVAREAEELVPVDETAATLDRLFNTRDRALQQPPGDSAILAKIAAGHEAQAVAAERKANALRHYDAASYQAQRKEIEQEEEHLFALEQGYGFKVCGTGTTPTSTGTSSTSPSSTTGSGSKSASAHLRIGQPAAVGNLSIRPISFERLSGSGEAVKWRLTMSVKNDGNEGAQPFCGGGQASLTDEQGRTYEGESAVNEASSVNCGDKVQPGLTGSPFIVDFKTPSSAKPATLSIWGESQYQEQAQTWTVR
jgi:hypothetical protein